MRLLVATALALAAALTSSVSVAKGLEPTRISLPKGPGSIEGLGRNFAPSLASGTASYGVDIAVPPSAGGFAPHLGLDYDSGGGVTDVGMGWKIGGIPSIRRRTENGLPKFDASDAFEITSLGIACDLLEMTAGMFRPEYESGAFVRVQRSGDTWEARDKSGNTYRFGGAGFTEAEGTSVATWLLREQIDLHGHKIAYEWDTASGHGHLQRVVWNDYGDDVRNVVTFKYENRPDPHVFFGTGIKQTLAKRLVAVDVTHGGALVRRYELGYAPGVHSRLATVDLVGRDGTSRLPRLSLAYTEPSFAANGQIVTMTTPPGRTPADPNIEISDLDGDGLPDVLVTVAGQYRSYTNHDGIAWKPGVDWDAAASPSVQLGSTGVQLADLDGDGAIDLVIKSGTSDFRYLPGNNATSFRPAVQIATVPNVTFEDPDVKLADMDGDRRIDVVATTAAGLAIGYNLNGVDWTVPAIVGTVDQNQPLRFSDGGHTLLCDVNGDRVQDFCYLRSQSLVYWLGRGRGRFEPPQTATGVPSWDPSNPWEMHDLDGDGWVDLVHVGVDQVDYALAIGAAKFDAVKTIAKTPTKGPNTTVRFADMNGSGTTDIVWIEVSGDPSQAWRYLDLFPKGRGGLLTRIDNGLGKITTMTYGPAAHDAAAARDAGKPWTTRMNVAMSVVKRTEMDVSLGDPVVAVAYDYRDGTWSPRERTFAGFGGGTDTHLGDEYTPTLVEESTFDVGLDDRTQRGLVLTMEKRDAKGAIFSRSVDTYVSKTLGTALNGRSIHYTFKSAEQTTQIEGGDPAKGRVTLVEFEQDDYGNVTAERRWGEVVASDKLVGNDEAIAIRTFANNTQDWILGRVATDELQDAAGRRVRMKRSFYDGAPFVGLPLGQVARGDLARQEEWVGPSQDQFELEIATAYDRDGNPTETKDARGGGHTFEWDAHDHTTILAENAKVESGFLRSSVEMDRAFGAPTAVTELSGQVTRVQYDAFARATAIVRPGDSVEKPTTQYEYDLRAPLSRTVTVRRIWIGRDDVERQETLFDGAGRSRGTLSADDGGRWVLGGVNRWDARGETRRVLRPRSVTSQDHDTPPLAADGPGRDAWRDAMGRTVRTRTQLGIETRDAFEPFVTKHWNGGQTSANAAYEHTPRTMVRDGLGRVLVRREMLKGVAIDASFTYDAAGSLTSKKDPEGNVSTYQYDGRGRRLVVDDRDTGKHVFGYDATGNIVAHHRPTGVTSRYSFDVAGRRTASDWDGDGKPEATFVFDRSERFPDSALYRGRLAKSVDPSGSTEKEYDERGRVTVVHRLIGDTSFDVASAYDDQDREYWHQYPDKSSLRIYRDPLARISGYGKAITLVHDADGVELQRSFNTGVVQIEGYDDDRRHTETVSKAPSGLVLQHLKWSYDEASNIVAVDDLRAGVAATVDRSEHYTYDNNYRLTGAKGSWGETKWTYSPSGNTTSRTSTERSQDAGSLSYGNAAGPHALTGFKGRTIAYDAAARMTNDGDRTYTWDATDQLVAVTSSNGASSTSTFDADGMRRIRVERDANGQTHTTKFIDVWCEVRDGQLVRFIAHGDRRIAKLSPSNGVPKADATARLDEAAEPPGGRTQLAGFARDLPTTLICAALLLVLGFRYRRQLLKGVVFGAPLVVFALAMIGCSSSHDDPPPPILDGTIQVLSDADDLTFGDGIGSLTEQTSGTGTPKGSFASYPFGLPRYDTSGETRKYANSPRDVGVGLDQMGARSYAPDLGVWTSPDSFRIDHPERGLSRSPTWDHAFAYAGQSPISVVDPDGRNPAIAGVAVGGTAITVVEVLIVAVPVIVVGIVACNAIASCHDAVIPPQQHAAPTWEARPTESSGTSDAAPIVEAPAPPPAPKQKTGPKPAGVGPHNQVRDKRIEELKGQGMKHVNGGSMKEETVKTEGGEKGSRRLDITMERPDRTKYREQIGKVDSKGQPVTRENKAMNDIEHATGERPVFTPYNGSSPGTPMEVRPDMEVRAPWRR